MAEEKESLEETGEAGAKEEKVEEVKAVKEADKDARLWGMLCHLAGLAGFAFPFGNVILPLIFWQLKKNEYAFVDAQGKEAVNFQISMTIYGLVTIPLFFLCIGPFLLAAVAIVDLVFLLIAAIKANNGESYRYPLAIRLIK
jgi:uncharacterized Tic20 family protein